MRYYFGNGIGHSYAHESESLSENVTAHRFTTKGRTAAEILVNDEETRTGYSVDANDQGGLSNSRLQASNSTEHSDSSDSEISRSSGDSELEDFDGSSEGDNSASGSDEEDIEDDEDLEALKFTEMYGSN